MDISLRLAQRLRALRDARGHSLDALAELSGVSRSNISLIERGESSPTANVLDKLAGALGVTLASLFEEEPGSSAPSPVARLADQPVWTDPAVAYMRRNVSPPAAGSPIQLVDVVFPAGARVAFDDARREADTHQQVWMIDGAMDVTAAGETWRLEAGDCLAMRLDGPIGYHNPTARAARYLVALVTLPGPASRRRAA